MGGRYDLLCFSGFVLILSVTTMTLANHLQGLSAVTVKDQFYNVSSIYPYYNYCAAKIKSWVTTANQGLFINGEFKADSNSSMFLVSTSGVYYVTANIILVVGEKHYSSWHDELYGEIHLQNMHGSRLWMDTSMDVESYIQLSSTSSSQQVTIKIAGYLLLQSGWRVSIQIMCSRTQITINAGSTLSLLYTSKPFAFPGIKTYGIWQYHELKSPGFTEYLKPEDLSSMLWMPEGNFVAPLNGLYHVVANIAVYRKDDVEFKFAIVVNNNVQVLSKNVTFASEEQTTITLEGVLDLIKHQTISISISSNKNVNASLRTYSTVSICYKGEISNRYPGLSVTFRENRMPANTWNMLRQWNVNAKPFLHFGNMFQNVDQFVSSKSGFYYVSLVISIRSCNKALAKLNLKQSLTGTVNAVSPGFHFVAENQECHLDVSLILRLNINDTLQVYVKSDKAFTVNPTTTLQILYHKEIIVWPAARFTITHSFPFATNKPLTKVTGWSPSIPKIGYHLFFIVSEDNIKIRVPGLYIVSCSIVLKGSSKLAGQFESQLSVNGKATTSGIKCRRNNTPQSFTCVMSTILNLFEKDSLAFLVKTNDPVSASKKESMSVLPSSSMSVILVGDTRSHPSFRLVVPQRDKPYITKAKTTTSSKIPSVSETSNTTNTFIQNHGLYMYSELYGSFKTGSKNAFFIQSSMQFRLLSDGQVSSVVGSWKRNTHAYSPDQTKGLTSVLASSITFNDNYDFNISGKAFDSDFKWETQPSSIVAGLYIGNSESLTTFEAYLSPGSSTNCSSEWRRVVDWTELLGAYRHNGKMETFKISQGLFFVFLNFVMETDVPGKTVQVAVFHENNNVLFASETTPKGGSNIFSIPLEGLVALDAGNKIIDIRIKCSASFAVTFLKQTSISGFQIDKDPKIPGLHWRLTPSSAYYTHSASRKYIPYDYNRMNQRNNDYYATSYIKYNLSTDTTSIPRTGIYFVSLTGELNDKERSDFIFSTTASATSCLYSNPIFFKKSNNFVRSVSASGLVFLRKDESFALVDLPGRHYKSYWANHYHYYYDRYSHVYLSLHYIGDLEISNGFSSTLRSSKNLAKGSNLKLMDTEWLANSTCGRFSTADIPTEFEKYKVSYSGMYMFSVSLMLTSEEECHVSVCFVVDGHSLQDHQSCFEHHIMNDNTSTNTTSTVGGSVLLYLDKQQQVSIKVKNTCDLTISNRSSLSMVDLGRNALFGFSAAIATAKATLTAVLLERSDRLFYRYYRYPEPEDTTGTTAYDVQGWTTDSKNSKMVFKRGLPYPLNEMFVCSRTGIYLIIVKLHVKVVQGKVLMLSDGCVVSGKLAIDSTDMNIGVQQLFSGKTNTLSFSTTIMIRKWQAITVRFTNVHEKCGEMQISQGSTFAAIYMAGSVESYIMPSADLHIVKIPPSNVYIRADKAILPKLTCKAVGEDTLKYQWINDDKEVISTSSILDVKKLNSVDASLTCVVTMGTVVSRSTTVSVTFFDPTPKFIQTYSNVTYYFEEKRANVTQYSWKTIVTLGLHHGVRRSYYHWFYVNPINCYILNDYNSTFYITKSYHYEYFKTQFYELQGRDERIDREKRAEYNVTISCANTEYKDAPNATTTLHVVILDVNDNLPVFQKPIYNTTIPRNIHPGEDIIQVMATDDDVAQNGKIAYKLLYTSDSYIFMIDRSSGVISLSSYGRLAKPTYILTVEATDQGRPPLSSYVTVVLLVKGFIYNRTNHHPIFEKKEYTAYLIQLAPIGSLVKVVRAYDPDTLDKKSIIYSIYSGDDKTFEIDSKTGLITTKRKLSAKTYTLFIAAEYLDKQATHEEDKNITKVTVKVDYVDVTKPNFLESHYNIKVKEDAAINTTVLQVKAVDESLPGQSYLKYSIPTPQEEFVIDPRSGKIRVAAKLDYETTKRYIFVVSVSVATVPFDTSQSSCTDVTIDIKDVNDNTPIIVSAPKEIHFGEHTPIGTLIGNVTAIDHDQGDNGKIKYYLEDDFGDFYIDPDNGSIFTKEVLDCCDVVYGLRVEVKDEGVPPRSKIIDIDVSPEVSNSHHGSHKMIIIIASSCGAVAGVLISIITVIYCKRRKRLRNFASSTMNYMSLPTDEEDEELLDPTGDDENNRRLSLISGTSSDHSAGSQENLLRREVPC